MEIVGVEKSIFANLKTYLTSKSKYNPYVSMRVTDNKNPLVVITEERNDISIRTTNYVTNERLLNYSINIFADDDVNTGDDSVTISKELTQLVSEVMENYYHANGGVIGKIPRYDDTTNTYQVQMRYTLKYDPSRAKLY